MAPNIRADRVRQAKGPKPCGIRDALRSLARTADFIAVPVCLSSKAGLQEQPCLARIR